MTTNENSFGEVTKSISQLCNQVSLVNISVPKFSSCSDVFEFISLFEAVTVTFSDEQKCLLLNKAFPPGKHRSWFESELQPTLDVGADWKQIKKLLIERFSATGDRDRHFEKLLTMKYNPSSDQSLLEFVEDMAHSYRKAFPVDPKQPTDPNESESELRYIRAALPPEIKAKLSTYPNYMEAKNLDAIKKVARLYDISNGGSHGKSQVDRKVTSELATILKDMIKGIEKEGQETRKAIVAAFQPSNQQFRPPSPGYRLSNSNYRLNSPNYRAISPQRDRGRSPIRSNYQQNIQRNEQVPIQGHRPASPRNYDPNHNNNYRKYPQEPLNQNNIAQQSITPKANSQVVSEDKAYSSEMYYQRFGKPPSPCNTCGFWHFNRHCLVHLN